MNSKLNYNYFISLILLHIIAHYIPFERLSLGADTYTYINKDNFSDFKNFTDYILNYHHRPLNIFVIQLQNIIVDNNLTIALILLICSTILITLIVYIFFLIILKDQKSSLLCTIIFDLYPSKVEMFHSLVLFNININIFFYILSITLFIIFCKRNNYIYYILSLLIYLLSIFWYEIGFFIFSIFIFYLLFFKYDYSKYKNLYIAIIPYFLICIFYLVYRYTNVFTFALVESSHQISNNLFFSILEILNNYIGRYFFKIIIYGIYSFINIDISILSFLVALDIIITVLLIRYLFNTNFEIINIKTLYLFLLLFIFSIIPNLALGNTGGRHTVIGAIAVSIIIFYSLTFFLKNYWKILFLFMFVIGLMTSQGSSWSHVVSGRISNEILTSLQDNKNEIINSDYIIFDLKSFSKNIKHTIFKRDYNVFYTYYGSQIIEDWGLSSMVSISTNKKFPSNKIYISHDDIVNNEDKILFTSFINDGYKKIKKIQKSINNNKVLIIDYNFVYQNSSSTKKNTN